MQILEEITNRHGYKLMIDNLDDLWHLYNIIDRHDIVASRTYRRLEKADDKLRPDKSPKKPVWLAIEVDSVEFHEFSNRLRVQGTIVKGPDELGLKAHHTLNFTAGDTIELEKPQPWNKQKLELLNNAVDASKQPKVTIVALEDDNAVIAQIFHYGVKNMSVIYRTGTGKYYSDSRSAKDMSKNAIDSKMEFFNNILIQLNQVRPGESPLILVGPGFTKDEFLKYLQDKKTPGIDNILLEPTGQAGSVGIQEAIKRGVLKRLVKDSRVAMETELIEKLLEGIAVNGLVTYGINQVKTAIALGAVDKLLVVDKFIRVKNEDIEKLLIDSESKGGSVIVISTVHDAGKQLESLGGFAAFLRYKLDI